MIDIGIIGAMEVEVNDLVSRLENRKCETVSGIDFHTGKLLGKEVAIAKCGIGKVFAAMAAEVMILKYAPKLLVNTGVGGALAKDLSTGDIVIANKLCQHDMDTSPLGDPVGLISGINKIYFEADKKLINLAQSVIKEQKFNFKTGVIASGDQFIATKEQKANIVTNFNAIACEMEGAPIGHTAYVNNVGFIVIRAISDSADDTSSMDYPTFLKMAAENSFKITLELINRI